MNSIYSQHNIPEHVGGRKLQKTKSRKFSKSRKSSKSGILYELQFTRHFLLVIFDLFQSRNVSSSFKFCGQPRVDNLFRQFFRNELGG
jgi:hypothetical protein